MIVMVNDSDLMIVMVPKCTRSKDHFYTFPSTIDRYYILPCFLRSVTYCFYNRVNNMKKYLFRHGPLEMSRWP